jgi:hypothetical protein
MVQITGHQNVLIAQIQWAQNVSMIVSMATSTHNSPVSAFVILAMMILLVM